MHITFLCIWTFWGALYGAPTDKYLLQNQLYTKNVLKPGPAQVLTPDEETALAQQCILLAKRGFPITDDFLQKGWWGTAVFSLGRSFID